MKLLLMPLLSSFIEDLSSTLQGLGQNQSLRRESLVLRIS